MLRARAIRDIEQQKQCCEACGIEYNGDLLYFAIFENETDCLGTCVFRYCPKGAEILNVKPKKDAPYDDEAMFILGKATLNFIDLSGTKHVIWSADDEKLCRLLEFYHHDGDMSVDLEGYFDEPCARKRKNEVNQ